MTRYRPPAAKQSPYITPIGMRDLLTEQSSIWLRRRDVVSALADAAAEGDRSENAEYIYRKRELAGIDRRIRYLQKRLPDLKTIDQLPTNQNQVFFGATVSLENKNGAIVTYRIVGPDELDRESHFISVDSPLARSLLKRGLGDPIEAKVPGGNMSYTIVTINY